MKLQKKTFSIVFFSVFCQPGSFEKADSEQYGTEHPVRVHGKPNARNAQPESGEGKKPENGYRIQRKNVSEGNAEDPHGEDGNDHGKFYVAGGTEDMGRCKCDWPNQTGGCRVGQQ